MIIEQKQKSILDQLNERKSNREGKVMEWIKSEDPQIVKNIVGFIFVQPLTALEIDQCRAETELYLCSQEPQLNDVTKEEIRPDVMASAALSYAIRDVDTKERIFKSDHAIRELRSRLTNDEVFYLSQILDCVTFSFSSGKHWMKEDVLAMATRLYENGDSSVLEAVHVNQLINMVMILSKELEKSKLEIESLNKKPKTK